MICKRCKGTGTVWLEGSIHGEDYCPNCSSFVEKTGLVLLWEEFKHIFNIKIKR